MNNAELHLEEIIALIRNAQKLNTLDLIDWDTSATNTDQTARMKWNSEEGTLDLGLLNDVVLQLGQEQTVLCKNQTGSDITDGTPVMFAGSVGASGRLKIMPAIADGTYLPAYTIGVVTQTIANGDDGYVTTFGKIRGIDTSGTPYGEVWSDGDIIYVSASAAGYLTNVMPVAPNLIIPIGAIVYADSHVGTMFVRPTWHQSIQDSNDVDGTPLTTDGQILVWNDTNKYFDPNYNINDYIPYTQNDITREPTGFTSPENVVITGDGTTRTVTLTGTVNAYYKGILNTTIVNSWTSPAHDNTTTKTFFLLYNGSTIDWFDISTLSEDFYSNLLIAIAFYNGSNWVYQRECHGVMDWKAHREIHDVLGTYKESGGAIGDYTLASTTVADRRPSISATLIYDEDCPTTNPTLSAGGNYTQFSLSGASAIPTFNTTATDIVALSTNQPYWNEFTGGAWQQTLLSNNYHMSIWVLAVPTCIDTNSQKMRYVFIQGQTQHLNLDDEKAVTTGDIVAGSINALTPEFVFLGRIIIKYTGGNWQIVYVESISGTRYNQQSAPQGNYLSSVTTDDTLAGLGTASSPLEVSGVGFELSADPSDPASGSYVMWMSDGTGTGDAGDILIKINNGTSTKTTTLVDFSAI